MSLSGGRPFKSPPPPPRFFFRFMPPGSFPLLYFPFSLSPPPLQQFPTERRWGGRGGEGKSRPLLLPLSQKPAPGKKRGRRKGRRGKVVQLFSLGKLDPLLFLPARTSNQPNPLPRFRSAHSAPGRRGERTARLLESRLFYFEEEKKKPSFILERCQRPPPPPATQPASLRRPWQ